MLSRRDRPDAPPPGVVGGTGHVGAARFRTGRPLRTMDGLTPTMGVNPTIAAAAAAIAQRWMDFGDIGAVFRPSFAEVASSRRDRPLIALVRSVVRRVGPGPHSDQRAWPVATRDGVAFPQCVSTGVALEAEGGERRRRLPWGDHVGDARGRGSWARVQLVP